MKNFFIEYKNIANHKEENISKDHSEVKEIMKYWANK